MKKILMLILTVCAFNLVDAQTPSPSDSLKAYTGKFKFPDGNPVTEIIVTIENGILTAGSAIGSSELKHREGDIFDLVAYAGTCTFKRNGDGKVNKMRVQVNELDMEGEKTEGLFLYDSFWQHKK